MTITNASTRMRALSRDRAELRITTTPAWSTLFVLYAVLTAGIAQFVPSGGHPDVPWLVGLAFGAFVFTFKSPAFALLPILITELTVKNEYLTMAAMSQRLAVIALAFIITLPTLLRSGRFTDRSYLRILIPSLAFIVIATYGNFAFSNTDYTLQYFRYQVVLLIAFTLAAMLIRTREDLRRLAVATLIVGVMIAMVSIWQHYDRETAPYGMATSQDIRFWNGRSIGFPTSAVQLADQTLFVLAPLMGVLLAGPIRRDKTRGWLMVAMLVIAAGLNFTYTRSAVFALGPGILMIGVMLRGARRIIVIAAIIAAVLAFPLLETTGLIGYRYFRDSSDDQSAQSHEALWQVSYAIARDNWMSGIGHEHFEEAVLDYADVIDTGSDTVSGQDAVGQRPHNDWLSVWLSWGIVALLVYVAIFLAIIWNLYSVANHPDYLIRGLAIGTAGGLIAYSVSSAYHNYLDSSLTIWLYGGLAVVLVRLAGQSPLGQLSGRHQQKSSPSVRVIASHRV